MKQGLSEFENEMDKIMRSYYHFDMSSFTFIPVGDSAHSYVVEDAKRERRYIKVFDTATRKGKMGVVRLRRYLPFMMELVQSNLFPELPRPCRTTTGELQCQYHHYTCVMFDYIHGETLADAYPFSDDIQTRVARQLAKLHGVPLAKLQSNIETESFSIDFSDSLQRDLKTLESFAGDNPFIRSLQSIVLPKRESINRFFLHLSQFQAKAIQSNEELVLCHGDLWGGNIIDNPDSHPQPIFLDWEMSIAAPKERDLFSYIGSTYKTFQAAYAQARQAHLSVNPQLVEFYAYRHQLANLAQWIHNLLHENFGDEQKHNDLDMIQYHCLNRWESIEATIMDLLC